MKGFVCRACLVLLLAPAGLSSIALAETPPPFRLKWGVVGADSGQFSYPTGVATDAAGNVYVAEQLNYRIQKFTRTGAYLGQWGSSGSGSGEFYRPYGVAVDTQGYVYVADAVNHRIQKFTGTGVYVTQWGSFGSGPGQFNTPALVATDASDAIYVADYGNHRIQKFTSAGGIVTQWGTLGTGNGEFSHPTGVATDSDNNVYVTDYDNNRVQKFTDTGIYMAQWGSTGSGDGQFSAPSGIATDCAGRVYVADTGNHRIQKFTGAGDYLTQWGAPGTGDGQFDTPIGVATGSTIDIYVADSRNHRIQKFGRGNGLLILTDNSGADELNGASHVNSLVAAFTAASNDAGLPVTLDSSRLTDGNAMSLSDVSGYDIVLVVTVSGSPIDATDVATLKTAVLTSVSTAFMFFTDACGQCQLTSAYAALSILNALPGFSGVGLGAPIDLSYAGILIPANTAFASFPETLSCVAYSPMTDVPPANVIYRDDAAPVGGNTCALFVPAAGQHACLFVATEVTQFWTEGGISQEQASGLANAYLTSAVSCPLCFRDRPVAVAVEERPFRALALSVAPNPLRSEVAISYVLPTTVPVRLTVHDVAGRRLATLVDAVQTAGAHRQVWHVTEAARGHVPSGVYMVRLAYGDVVRTAKVVLER